jgi:hypothetical protein
MIESVVQGGGDLCHVCIYISCLLFGVGDGGHLHLIHAIAKRAMCAYAITMWPRSLRDNKDLVLLYENVG